MFNARLVAGGDGDLGPGPRRPGSPLVVRREDARWVDGKLTANGMEPLSLERLAKKAHELGLVTGATVHGFNRWSGPRPSSSIDGVRSGCRSMAWRCATATGAEREEGAMSSRRLPRAGPAGTCTIPPPSSTTRR